MLGHDGERNLASGAGRKTQKSGGEAQKMRVAERGKARCTGSTKPRKG